ncbi:Fic family protein [Sansalvadorimonas sp. 2012CJ34-2]|uniref:Fic family protein n=1 Tax=Parendozoicomonas callyspongiae TaxID=2942213 RepID=A0ABT0PJK0_9GAMM|nr:Fic family protein [Sansalvadorimonas sp. 2012CJ34-2]MCL6271151.1 Fic family protein [Sansalvadorimonas sp. 2012CJ34-2]
MRSYTGGLLGTRPNQVQRHQILEQNFPDNARPEETMVGHLLFALKHEGVNPGYLRQVFQQGDIQEQIKGQIEQRPNSQWSRRLWFWYEYLTGHQQEPDYRVEQNYIGGPGPQGVALTPPQPEHIEDLMDDWFAMVERLSDSDIPASIRAGILSASFVYLHPFMDGNGRISRYLIQDVLAKSGILQPGIILPVSGGILNRQQDYYRTLDQISRTICDQTDFYIDEAGHITIEGETDHLFRYLDLTTYCQWLCEVIRDVAESLLPKEIDMLVVADKLYHTLDKVLGLSAKDLRLMVKIILDNNGKLSKRKCKQFEFLTDADFIRIEDVCQAVLQK